MERKLDEAFYTAEYAHGIRSKRSVTGPLSTDPTLCPEEVHGLIRIKGEFEGKITKKMRIRPILH